jgi:hypothetical protein
LSRSAKVIQVVHVRPSKLGCGDVWIVSAGEAMLTARAAVDVRITERIAI